MSSSKLSPGDITEARCTRCLGVMNHTIVAMVEERIVRVQCNTCSGVHNYRSPHPPVKAPAAAKSATPRAAATPRARKDPGAAERQEWAEQIVRLEPGQAVAYTMDGKFKAEGLVKHTVFGLGIVKRQMPGKVEILFADGKKLLKSR